MKKISWILPGRLGAMSYPSGHHDIQQLAQCGVTAILSLTEEATPVGVSAGNEGLRWLHIPLRDFHAPTLKELDESVGFIRHALEGGGSVIVHCWAGLGRTGTILAAYLVSTGVAPAEAMERIRRVRPGSIETTEQEQSISEYYFERMYLAPTP